MHFATVIFFFSKKLALASDRHAAAPRLAEGFPSKGRPFTLNRKEVIHHGTSNRT